MDMGHGALQIVATGEDGTRCALNEAKRLADGARCRLVLLVPYIQSRFPSPADRHETGALTECYRELARAAGVDAVVRVCVCRRLDDIFRWMLERHARVVIGGRRRRWWPTPAERTAQRLRQLGHEVVFVAV